MRILLLASDAFGGHGGIAQYNRNLLMALSAMDKVEEIVAIPRYVPRPLEHLPPKLNYRIEGRGGKIRYVKTVLKTLCEQFDLVLCGHINLLPLAWLTSIRVHAPLALSVHGIDVWQPHQSILTRVLLRRVDAVWSVSEFTRDKMAAWSQIAAEKFHVLPNTIALERYGMGTKDATLVTRYGLNECKVMMVLARLAGAERYKGVDELLELMPNLLKRVPELVFLLAGDGDDRSRLEAKANALGVADRVRFVGYVSESEKVSYYRLADAFVMPGRCEGFGIVYLEAMACGVPVVASSLDGSQEAVRFGKLGLAIDPDDRTALMDAIVITLNAEKRVPEGLDYFSFANFQSRLQALIVAVTAK